MVAGASSSVLRHFPGPNPNAQHDGGSRVRGQGAAQRAPFPLVGGGGAQRSPSLILSTYPRDWLLRHRTLSNYNCSPLCFPQQVESIIYPYQRVLPSVVRRVSRSLRASGDRHFPTWILVLAIIREDSEAPPPWRCAKNYEA